MKINHVGTSGVNPYKSNLNKVAQLKNAASRSKDKIEISTTAKELQHSSQLVAQRQAKVEEIKLSLENGTYSVDLKETAKSMIDFYTKK
ncbi:MAG: flagellar biosynthesis anti-sigma factor FlgM [Bacillus sp. (in: firmicutes)]